MPWLVRWCRIPSTCAAVVSVASSGVGLRRTRGLREESTRRPSQGEAGAGRARQGQCSWPRIASICVNDNAYSALTCRCVAVRAWTCQGLCSALDGFVERAAHKSAIHSCLRVPLKPSEAGLRPEPLRLITSAHVCCAQRTRGSRRASFGARAGRRQARRRRHMSRRFVCSVLLLRLRFQKTKKSGAGGRVLGVVMRSPAAGRRGAVGQGGLFIDGCIFS